MNRNKLYPELIDYIYQYCDKFKTADEKMADRTIHLNSKNMNEGIRKQVIEKGWYSDSAKIKEMIQDGFESFKNKVVERIFKEHKDELSLNLCPMCGKIARTPWAKQCRFCFHDWH